MAGFLAPWRLMLRHRWQDGRDSQRAVPPDMAKRLSARVAASERRHSGELRLCVEASLPMDSLWQHARHGAPLGLVMRERALSLFGRLRVWDTAHNNGVLIYVLLAERHIDIVADRGLNERVSTQAWAQVAERLAQAFKANLIEDGLTAALAEVSALLVQHFEVPASAHNPDELANEPVVI